jgi:dTDP-4-dehydrorhamnose 3,5-epimerase-like enzyme
MKRLIQILSLILKCLVRKNKMDTNYTVKDCILVDVPTFTDERGAISVLDKELPFQVRRVFWLHHIKDGKDRGAHALLDSSEIMVAVHGSFIVDLDDTMNKTSILLDDPSKGLVIKPGVWFRTHSYKEDGVSLILAEEEYARDKYTYDYEEYKRLRK